MRSLRRRPLRHRQKLPCLLRAMRLECGRRPRRRAHPEDFEKPREAEVLDFLGTMCSVLKLCGCVAGAKNVWKVLNVMCSEAVP